MAEALNGIQRARYIAPRSSFEISALRWELYAVLQNTLDAIAMIVAELGLRKPSTYSELGRVLCGEGLLDEPHANIVGTIASTRNTLAHAYRRLKGEDLSAVAGGTLPNVEKLIGKLQDILEHKEIDPCEVSPLKAGKLAEVFAKHGVTLAYLFGSRARRTAREDSDYDIAVLFQRGDVTILDEVELAKDVALTLEVPVDRVDIVALNGADGGLVARVLKEGVPVYRRSDSERRRWERNAYLDLLRHRDLDALYVARAFEKASRHMSDESPDNK